MLSAILNESPVVEDGHKKPFRSSCMSVVDGHVHINGFSTLPESIRMAIEVALSSNGVTAKAIEDDILRIPRQVSTAQGDFNMAAVLGRITGFVVDKRLKLTKDVKRDYPDTLDVEDILIRARVFGEFIEKKKEEIVRILLQYETYKVAEDEISRTLDLLYSLNENSDYFQREVGAVSTFLPSNQPLYSLACFGIVPALMAPEASSHRPSFMDDFFTDLVEALDLN